MNSDATPPAIHQEWKNVHSVADVCKYYPDRIKALFAALDLERPELAEVKKALDRNDPVAAGEALLEHYRSGNSGKWLRRNPVAAGEKTTERSEKILADQITSQEVTATIPRDPKTGSYQWRYKGPRDDQEYAWFLNRQFHLQTLLHDYLATGNPRYAQRIDEQIRDWVVSSQPYPAAKLSDAMWRGAEVSYRVKAWARIFYGLSGDSHFSPAARLLLLSSLPEHAHYARNFYSAQNYTPMELSSLGIIGLAWPEFRESADWLAYSKKTLNDELTRQVYPDGVQNELTSLYHYATLENFEILANACREANSPLPEAYTQNLEKMWNYLARALMPNGKNTLNNDSDTWDMFKRILKEAERYNRPDWRYIASRGQEGEPPTGLPSTLFPWAGQLISRNGWDADAHWSFFDIGPSGVLHYHNDHLHLSLHAHGRDLLVDSGRFAYHGELAKRLLPYARHSRAHNVILIDGQGQVPDPKVAGKPLDETRVRITKEWDYAASSYAAFEKLEGPAQHQRALLYVRDRYWIVLDRVITQQPRDISPLWHFHPQCQVEIQGSEVVSVNPGVGNLRITPAGPVSWKVEIVTGQENPEPQGWYSPGYNQFEPSPTAVYQAKIPKTTAFAWVMVPAKGEVPPVKVEWLEETAEGVRLRIAEGNLPPDEGFIPFQNAALVKWPSGQAATAPKK